LKGKVPFLRLILFSGECQPLKAASVGKLCPKT